MFPGKRKPAAHSFSSGILVPSRPRHLFFCPHLLTYKTCLTNSTSLRFLPPSLKLAVRHCGG